MIDLIKAMLDRGLLDMAEIDTEWLRNSFRKEDPRPDR
jgi:hypothetical protein